MTSSLNRCDFYFKRIFLFSKFNLIYFSSIMKQVFTTYLDHSRGRFLEPTSTGVTWGIMIVYGSNPRSRGCEADTFPIRPPLPFLWLDKRWQSRIQTWRRIMKTFIFRFLDNLYNSRQHLYSDIKLFRLENIYSR